MAGRVSDDELQLEQPGVVEETATFKPKVLVSEYLLQRLPVYQRLRELQKKGWEDPRADSHYKKQREHADNPTPKDQSHFFKMMINIARELDKKTGVFRSPGPDGFPKAVLDLCMAPGGFSTFALQKNPSVLVRGISLPPSLGGHNIRFDLAEGSRADYDWSDSDPGAPIHVDFRDITLLADEMGSPSTSIPASHQDAASFSSDRPFLGQKFDLVFCDGQVLRTHERKEYRESSEAMRLLTSQLVIAMQRIRRGGSMVVLLHKADAWWPSVILMHAFSQFSDRLILIKPTTQHTRRGSFYLIAQGINPKAEAAVQAVEQWKARWRWATFGEASGGADVVVGDNGSGVGAGISDEDAAKVLEWGEETKVRAVLDEFGPKLVELVAPVFQIQADALENPPWAKGNKKKNKKKKAIPTDA